MSIRDIADALQLVDKGLLSPGSFMKLSRKVVSLDGGEESSRSMAVRRDAGITDGLTWLALQGVLQDELQTLGFWECCSEVLGFWRCCSEAKENS